MTRGLTKVTELSCLSLGLSQSEGKPTQMFSQACRSTKLPICVKTGCKGFRNIKEVFSWASFVQKG